MNKEKIYNLIPYVLYSLAGYLLIALALAAVKMAPGFFSTGVWLLKSFGIIAFYIPVYFALCGVMASREEIPLKSLLRLNLSFLPFFTLALMLHVITGNTELLIVAKITEALGRIIASLVLFFLAGLEFLILTKLSDLLFPDEALTLSQQLRKGKVKNSSEENFHKENQEEDFASPEFPEAPISPLQMPRLNGDNRDYSFGRDDNNQRTTIGTDIPVLTNTDQLIKSILNGESVDDLIKTKTNDKGEESLDIENYDEDKTPDSYYTAEDSFENSDLGDEQKEETVEFYLDDPAISFLSDSNPVEEDTRSALNDIEDDIENIKADEKLNYLISSLDSVLENEGSEEEENSYQRFSSLPEEDRDNIGIDHKFEEEHPSSEEDQSNKNYDYLTPQYTQPEYSDDPFSENSYTETSKETEDSDFGITSSENKIGFKETTSVEKSPVLRSVSRPVSHSAKKRGNYSIPVEGVLNDYPGFDEQVDANAEKSAKILEKTLEEFNIEAKVTGIKQGPVITMFEILPSPGVKLSKIVGLQDNIALRLAASRIRIVAPIPGKHAVGIEIPNKKRELVSFQSIIGNRSAKTKEMALPFFLGTDIGGGPQIMDLAKTPHLLIAGSTGSGKSVCVNSLICSLLYEKHPNDVKMILVDPKIVELKLYNDIPHLLTPVITETKRALQALQWALYEMEKRYSLLDGIGVRDIVSYNKRIKERNIAAEKLPYILIVIDEFADLMATAGKELEGIVARLAAMARAVGIHLVLATQRPSTNVITGLIKANFPSRIAFMVAQMVDSRIIIDTKGAEKLLGKGDMLFTSSWDPFPTRLQGAFLSEDEVERVCNAAREFGEPEYIDDEIFYDDEEDEDRSNLYGESSDPLFNKATEIVFSSGKASASYLQRRLQIGYNRAARIIEEMEDQGMVGPANGSKARDVIGSHSGGFNQSAGM